METCKSATSQKPHKKFLNDINGGKKLKLEVPNI